MRAARSGGTPTGDGDGTDAPLASWTVTAVAALALVALSAAAWAVIGLAEDVEPVEQLAPSTLGPPLVAHLVGWTLLVGVVVGLALARLRPAQEDQPLLPRGAAHDAVWVIANGVIELGAAALVVATLRVALDRTIGPWSIETTSWGASAAVVVMALLLADLVRYLSHRIRHRVAWCWRFHAVHHAQRELTPLTEHRIHPVEHVHHALLTVWPLALLDVSAAWLAPVYAVLAVHTRLYHANVRTDYGVLRWVLVTPQSHRIHHSTDPRHHDTNFGVVLSVWDRLLGTQWHDHREYPPVGVDDPTFPHGSGATAWQAPRVWASQLLHPLRRARPSPPPTATATSAHPGPTDRSARPAAVLPG